MKKIYVTVAEFLENGGDLKEGRDIYSNEYGTTKSGTFVRVEDEELIRVQTNKSDAWPFYKTHSFVQINCQPIYK